MVLTSIYLTDYHYKNDDIIYVTNVLQLSKTLSVILNSLKSHFVLKKFIHSVNNTKAKPYAILTLAITLFCITLV